MKRVRFPVQEEHSFLVTFEKEGELYGMYVWGTDTSDAKRRFKQREPNGHVRSIELKSPD